MAQVHDWPGGPAVDPAHDLWRRWRAVAGELREADTSIRGAGMRGERTGLPALYRQRNRLALARADAIRAICMDASGSPTSLAAKLHVAIRYGDNPFFLEYLPDMALAGMARVLLPHLPADMATALGLFAAAGDVEELADWRPRARAASQATRT